jgi:hypothetical protein
MDAVTRLCGSAASLSATLFQLAVIFATAPHFPECGRGLCWRGGDPGPIELFIAWQPYIDNAGIGTLPPTELRCPGRQSAGSPFRLDYAPLPAGFDAHVHSGADILACVKLGADGAVEAVRIVAGTGRARLDSQLLRSIHRRWRFRPLDGVEAGPPWQRVRLNSALPPPEPMPLL